MARQLRAKPPGAVVKRPKVFLFGDFGTGKTTAAIQFPKPYIFDCEKGAENESYVKLIKKAGGVVMQTVDSDEVVEEVKTLRTVPHDFRTVVIDPITTVYDDLIEKGKQAVGDDFGRHYGYAGNVMKRLSNLLLQLDMAVIVTSHAKPEYGDAMQKTGVTFDAWRRMPYIFDLVLRLEKRPGGKRVAVVVKSRIPERFKDEETFEWSYAIFRERYGEALEAKSKTVKAATAAQIKELLGLIQTVKLPDTEVQKWKRKACVEEFEDFTYEQVAGCIRVCRTKIEKVGVA